MTRTLRVDRAAEEEIGEAFAWYEARHAGLGRAFVAAIDVALVAIAREPEAWPAWERRARFRRYVVQRFPYVVFYRVAESEVHVVAIAHAKRRPGYWIGRR